MPEDKTDFEKLQALVEHFIEDSKATKEEYFVFFESFLKLVKDLREKNKLEMDNWRDEVHIVAEKIVKGNDSQIASLKELAMKEILDASLKVDAKIATVKDGSPGLPGKDIKLEDVLVSVLEKLPKKEEIIQEIPILGEKVRDSLELLSGDERLDAKAIKGLPELEKKVSENTRVGWGAHPLVIQEDGEVRDKVARILNFKGPGLSSVVRNADGTIDITINDSDTSAVWGDITGDINDQTDLQDEFDDREALSIAYAVAL